MTNLITSQSIEGYEKAKEILKECKSTNDIEITINKLKEIEVDFPSVKWISATLEQMISITSDDLIPDLIPIIINNIDEKIEELKNRGENKFVNFLYSIFNKGEALRIILFYSDLLILLHKSRREGGHLLQTIKIGEETRDSLILQTELTFEKINIEWILKENVVKERIEKMEELELLLEKTINKLLVDKDISVLGEFLEKFEPLFKNIFGKTLNYEKYEKNKNLEWIERKIKENDKRKTQIDQFDNLEFLFNTTNLNFKTIPFLSMTVVCQSCNKAHKLIFKFDPNEYVGDYLEGGFIGFPKDDILNCKCGHIITLSTMRDQIEKATGKKLATNYEDDKKLGQLITLELICPKCNQKNLVVGKFYHSSRFNKLCEERGARPLPKNNILTCICGRAKWDLKDQVKRAERELGMKLIY
ncbi:MAG: hypothetical protein ACFFD2_10220 [Promethearchaeota archaeon]